MKRYIPQSRLLEIGEEGQNRLLNSHVLIVGCGALGSPVAMYLAGAGVGHITIADFDTVEISNLHRQVFYTESEIGKGKAEILKKRILELNSDVKVNVLEKLVTKKLLESLKDGFDLIVDAADNPATTYMLDEFCYVKGVPLSIAGVTEWRAQVFFYYPGSMRYSEIFPRPADDNSSLLPCSVAGITGPVAAFAASLQSSDVIKYFVKAKEIGKSRLITANLLSDSFDVFEC